MAIPQDAGGATKPAPKKPIGAFNIGESASKAWRERLLAKRAQGVIYRDSNDRRPTKLSQQGAPERKLNPWQTNPEGHFVGSGPPEMFPKELPDGAIDWDDNGNPYYGGRTPFQEWQLRAHANLGRKEQITEEQASWDDYDAPNIAEAFEGEKGDTTFQRLGSGLSAVASGVFETYEQASESVDYLLAGGDDEVNRLQTGWRQMSHYAGETLQRAGSLAWQTKLFFGGVAHLAEEKFQIGAGVGDDPVHFTERWKEINKASDQFAVAPKHDDLFWRKIGVSAETIDQYTQGALAGRMFYTSIWDNTVDRVRGISGTGQAGNIKKEEFLREMKDNPNYNPNPPVDPLNPNPPYDPNDSTTWPYFFMGTPNPTELEITPGEFLESNLTGNDLFLGINNGAMQIGGPSPPALYSSDPGRIDIFSVLTRTEEALRAGNVSDPLGAGGGLEEKLDNLDIAAEQNRRLRSQLGNKAARVDTAMLHQEDVKIDLHQILSRYQDADAIETFNEIVQQETAFQAALSITAKVSQISILNYF